MSLPKKKYCPDMKRVHGNSRKVCSAIKQLAILGIETISVDFNTSSPSISIMDCANNRFLNGTERGIKFTENKLYIKKVAFLDGCRIFWHETI